MQSESKGYKPEDWSTIINEEVSAGSADQMALLAKLRYERTQVEQGRYLSRLGQLIGLLLDCLEYLIEKE